MANKGMQNAIESVKNFFVKPTPADTLSQDQAQIGQDRDRERGLLVALKRINLADPQRRLSDAKVRELGVQGVVNYAIKELEAFPFVSEHDITNLDKNILKIINVLNTSIMEGRETAVEWGCTALVSAMSTLRTMVDPMDEEYSKEVMECRVQYSESLSILVQSAYELDFYTEQLAHQESNREEYQKQLDALKSAYLHMVEAGTAAALEAEIRQNANTPGAIKGEAKKLLDDLYEMNRLQGSILGADVAIDTARIHIRRHKSQLANSRNILSIFPHVENPALQGKIAAANNLFRARLRKQLNAAEEAMVAYDAHLSALGELANHSVQILSLAKAMKVAEEIKMERLEQERLAAEAAAMQARAEANAARIHNTIVITNPVQETVQETEPVVETEIEF